MCKVSIIVPVYKVEKYLSRCIDSILKQTFTDFELILVDDGSPDSCGVICDEYAKRDSRIRVIHQRNGGLSAARNSGLKIAIGKYVMFCDSDDYVEQQWCQIMYETICRNPNAWIVTDIWKVDVSGICNLRANYLSEANSDIKSMSYFQIYKLGLSGYVVNKIYSLEKIRKNGIFFDESCFFAEDVAFNVTYYMKCDILLYIPKPLYFYCDNLEGITGRYYADKFSLRIPTFSVRLQVIEENELEEYCDIWLYQFIQLLDNVFDKKNNMSFYKKIVYNQKMVKTPEFRYCVEHASGKRESPLFMRVLKMHDYYMLWMFNHLVQIKNKVKGKLT